MISLKIPEVKIFMAKLLTQEVFDTFIVKDMELVTFTSFKMNGSFHKGFFTEEELDERVEKHATLWSDIRSIAFAMIRGNKTPLSLKIVFQLPRNLTEKLMERLTGQMNVEDIGGLYMNVRFEKDVLHIITGTAIKTFTLDKTLEQEWDSKVKEILKHQGIIYEE
ncbi:MAG TPA: hypothetical protein GXZ21_04480 [Clostridiales bacterium]|nr:hypothetical protein [Clostridiales bacterium]